MDTPDGYVNLSLILKLVSLQGHNVVLLANHQTEADPAVMALLLESSHPYISENLVCQGLLSLLFDLDQTVANVSTIMDRHT